MMITSIAIAVVGLAAVVTMAVSREAAEHAPKEALVRVRVDRR